MGGTAHQDRTRAAVLMAVSLALIVSGSWLQRPHAKAARKAKQFLTHLTKDSAKSTVKQSSFHSKTAQHNMQTIE
jgi:hypothetical protein